MSRTRTQIFNHLVPQHVFSVDNNINDMTAPTQLTVGPTNVSRNNTMTDELTPGFFNDIRNGLPITCNPMSQNKLRYLEVSQGNGCVWTGVHSPTQTSRVITNLPIGYQGLAKWGQFNWATVLSKITSPLGFYTGDPFNSLASKEELLQKALAYARTTGLDAGTFAAEFNKTVNMIESFGTRFLKRLSAVIREAARRNPDRLAEEFSSVWLEARYGWRPLAYDIEDINSALNQLKDGIRTLGRGYAQDETTYPFNWSNLGYAAMLDPGYSYPSNNRSKLQTVATGEAVITRRAGCLVELVLDEIGFIDPLTTGWEVIPFSFIADWFINLGELISAHSVFASGSLAGAWTSDRVVMTRMFETIALPYQATPQYTVTGDTYGVARSVFKTYSREAVEDVPFNLSFKFNFNFLKLIDVVSIVVTRYFGLLRQIRNQTRL